MEYKNAVNTIRQLMLEHGIGVATPYVAVKENDMLCHPSIWVVDDLDPELASNIPEGMDQDEIAEAYFESHRAYKTMSERITEEGYEILSCLLYDAIHEWTNKE